MSRSRSRFAQVAVAVGVVSSICAAVGVYLYVSTNTASVPLQRRRRKIMVSTSSREDLLDFLPEDAINNDDIYITLLCKDDKIDHQIAELQMRCSHVLRHEKHAGLVHIARHVSPDLVIILPDLSQKVSLDEIKDWVGMIVSMDDELPPDNGSPKIKNVFLDTSYDTIVSSI